MMMAFAPVYTIHFSIERFSVRMAQVFVSSLKPSTWRSVFVFVSSLKTSTWRSIRIKWDHFSLWTSDRKIIPESCPLVEVFDCLFSLLGLGLAPTSIKVHLVVLSDFHVGVDNKTMVAHPLVKKFLKGLFNLYCPLELNRSESL